MSEVAEMVRAGMHPAEATSIDRDDAIKLIREALKKRSGKTWSVSGGRGTAWGWINVMSPPKRRVAHYLNPDYHRDDPRPDAVPHFEGTPDENHGAYYMSEDDCRELGELLNLGRPAHCQGVSIAASSDYRRVYITKALGLELASHAEPYWD